MLFENTFNDFDILSLSGFNFNKKELCSPEESFLKGNSFKDEYVPYKNMSYKRLKPRTKQEELLYMVMEYDFLINDLNLYLDLHPEDSNMYSIFKEYVNKYLKYKDMYVKCFGPLSLTDTESNEYKWLYNMPYEYKEITKYV